MKHVVCVMLPLLAWGCRSGAPAQQPTPREASPPPVTVGPTAARHTALPRRVAGVSLGMSRSQAERTLGRLTCHENAAGFQVCNAATEPSRDLRHLALYLSHDHVISVSYEQAVLANAWDALNALIDRYGRPSLSGVRERDKRGRLHEIYGWKDDHSLYSLRFIWGETEAGGRKLVGTAIALWDRQGFHKWETEMRQSRRHAPPRQAHQPHEPI
ncbi:MAG: hypothetical protein ACE5I7_15140 [Candidatus Binatia bacterium]